MLISFGHLSMTEQPVTPEINRQCAVSLPLCPSLLPALHGEVGYGDTQTAAYSRIMKQTFGYMTITMFIINKCNKRRQYNRTVNLYEATVEQAKYKHTEM